ncbi:ATP-grasp domain-containing protein [Halalkalibacterium halodurans]|nr:ATP-grasp domain-containing protein [Halalkalibacterium halodurans]
MSDLKAKKLLILGGSRISCEIVKKAKDMGIYTLVTDWYSEERSPAKKLADKAFMTSTADVSAVVDLIKKENVDGVITGFTDSTLAYYAQICQQAGLPCYGTKEQFETLTNKRVYKKLCRDFGVPVIDEYFINENIDTADLKGIKYPVLVKPADNSGGRGISICNNEQELITAYKKALSFSESKEILIERYITGKEVTAFYILQDGNTYLTAMANRHIKHNQSDTIALPVAYTFPSKHLIEYQKNIEPNVKKMFESLNMKNGMVFMQCIVKEDQCLVYDIGYRLTGTLEYKLLDAVCGYNPLEMLIRFALTGQMAKFPLKEKVTPQWDEYGCNVSFLIKPGTIEEIKGIDEILEIPGVIDAVLAHTEGDELPDSAKGTLRQIVLRVFAKTQSENELEKLLDTIYNKLTVLSSEGENMLLEGFDTEEIRGALC